MIHSMTGYGRYENNDSNYDVIVEVKSLNSRYLEVLPKIHESLYKYESNIISLVRKACKRGKVYLSINLIENHSISELVDSCLIKDQRKTINILNENNFTLEDCILIIRSFAIKLKRLQKIHKEYQKNKNLESIIDAATTTISIIENIPSSRILKNLSNKVIN